MTSRPVRDSETALRRAIEQRQFSLVESLALSYCAQADAHLSTLPPNHPARLNFLTGVIGFLRWTHLMLSTERAGYADRLRQLLLTKRYLTANAPGPSDVGIEL